MEINDKIQKLSEEDKLKFREELKNCLYYKHWCEIHGINYSDPNIPEAREKLYNELFGIKTHPKLLSQ